MRSSGRRTSPRGGIAHPRTGVTAEAVDEPGRGVGIVHGEQPHSWIGVVCEPGESFPRKLRPGQHVGAAVAIPRQCRAQQQAGRGRGLELAQHQPDSVVFILRQLFDEVGGETRVDSGTPAQPDMGRSGGLANHRLTAG
ncbi:hypothetical protein [Streptomyces sp. NPDC059455]|uniref:hypothetical protein n=1 Tax=Streptomyces sp. NPDC059455 TaxID=3346837 RepID=UPI0036CAB496